MNYSEIKQEYCRLRDRIVEKNFDDLDDNQRKAVFFEDGNLLVVAGPGAGKTRTIVNKVYYLVCYGNVYNSDNAPEGINIEDLNILKEYFETGKSRNVNRLKYLLGYKGVNPDNIIVITFTRAAAMNMKDRYKQISRQERTPFFGTFHSLFYTILKRHYGKINIIESNEAYRLIKSKLIEFMDDVSEEKIKETMNNISLYKTSCMDMEDFKPSIDKNIFKECYSIYEAYKAEKGLMDFDDLQLNCRKLFLSRPELLNSYRRFFKYILVDEFQDCDNLQLELLKMLNVGNYIFAVGDEDQCIYGFRGSKPDCMVNFKEDFIDGQKVFLSINYRSYKNIVDLSKKLIRNNKMRNSKDIEAFRGEAAGINIGYFPNESRQAEEVINNIQKIRGLTEGKYKDNAVLYRTNVESRSIIDICIRKKIPFKLLDKEYNFFEHFICKDIIAYLKLSLDMQDRESFFRIINKPFRYISKLNIEKVKGYPIQDNCFDILLMVDELPVFQIKNINELKKDINKLNHMSLKSAIDFIILDIGFYQHLSEYSAKFKVDISEMEEILEEFKAAAAEFNNIRDFLNHVEEVKSEIEKNKKRQAGDFIILSTIHGVKGMEFKNVFIINCNEENIPHANSLPNNVEEERRLFYVAVTRSIDNLWIGVPKTLRGKAKEASRFVEECEFNTIKFASKYEAGDRIYHNTYGEGKVLEINKGSINIEFDNGTGRLFDLFVLETHGLLRKV